MIGVVGELEVVIVRELVGGGGSFAGAAAGFVVNEVSRDGVEICGEFVIRLVALGVFPDTDENLLGDILGVAIVAQHFGDGADQGVLMAFDQAAEGRVIAVADFHHQLVVDRCLCVKRYG